MKGGSHAHGSAAWQPPLPAILDLMLQLPSIPTSFIGRDRELEQVRERLAATRLLTLTGPGGSGKTRLALETAIQLAPGFADGTYWCGLAALSDPTYVPQAVGRVMGIGELAGRSATEVVVEFIQSRNILLIFDNCEHLLDSCAALSSAILDACPNAKILATSLQPLGLPQEKVWQVPPLALPDAGAEPGALGQYDSVRLFVERATDVLPSFALDEKNAPIVAAICRRLDGLPLAIELAATRVKMLSPAQIAERLDDAFNLLTRGKTDHLPRHQTLRATMDWSYQLLAESERALLRRLSVFPAPFSLEMVETICGEGLNHSALDRLTDLVDKSLVSVNERQANATAHFRLLETVRQYARQKLEDSGESVAIRNRYLDWCTAWAEQAEPHLTRPEHAAWLRQFESHEEHFRAALRRACTNQQVEPGLRLANALGRFWMTGGMAEGRAWFEELLNLEASQRQAGLSRVSDSTRAWALFWSGRLAVRLGDDEHGARRGEESLALFRALGDSSGILSALNTLALVSQDTSDYARAAMLYDEALTLSRQTNNPRMTAVVLNNQGLMYYEQQDFRRAAPLWEEEHAIAERQHLISSLDNLGCLAMMQGDLARAQNLLEREWQVASETGDKHDVALALMDLGEVTRRQGDLARAETLLKDALERHQRMTNPFRIGENLVYLAHVGRNRGQIHDAKNLYEQSLPYLEKSNYTRYISHVKTGLGILEALQGRDENAMPFLREGLRIAQKGNHRLCRVEALEEIAGVWARQGEASTRCESGADFPVCRSDRLESLPHTLFRTANEAERAARFLTVTEAEREAIGAPIPPVERARYDQTVQLLHAALGDATFAAIQSDARTLTLDQIVAEAFSEETLMAAPVAVEIREPALRVFALGATRVVVGKRVLRPADWKYTKSKELFFYLLSNPPATKAQIGLDLWPDASPEQLRNIFHRALHYLRKALGHAEWIVYEDEAYTFDRRASFWCDLHKFEAVLNEVQPLLKSGAPSPAVRARAIEALHEATQLWRGDFLADMDAGEWAIFKREALRQSFLQALLDLGQLYFAEARYSDAVATFQRALSFDNYLEIAHRELMRSYARQGDAARALQHFSDLRRLMREELGAPPSAETLLLYDRLRRGDDV